MIGTAARWLAAVAIVAGAALAVTGGAVLGAGLLLAWLAGLP